MKTLITFYRVFTHLIGPLEVWLILYFLQTLVHRLPEHNANYLGNSRSSMPNKISLGSVVVIPLRPKIPLVLENYFGLLLSLLLVLLDSFILINMIHKLAYTPSKLPCQGLP